MQPKSSDFVYKIGGCVVIKAYGAASLFSGLRFGYLSCD